MAILNAQCSTAGLRNEEECVDLQLSPTQRQLVRTLLQIASSVQY